MGTRFPLFIPKRRVTPRTLIESARRTIRGFKPRSTEDRNILFVALDGATIGLSSAAGAFISVFVVRLGADAFWVSLLSSLPALIHLTLTLPLSRLVERQTEIVKVFAFTRLVGRLNFVIIGLLPFFAQNELAARAIVVMWGAEAVVTTVQQLLFTLVMNRAVGRERRATQMSGRWTFMGVTDILSMAVAGQVLERIVFPLNYQLLFFASFLVGLLSFYTIRQVRVRDEAAVPSRVPASGPLWARLKAGAAEILECRPFLSFEGARNVFWLGISMISPLIPIYWVKNLAASDAWVSYFNTAHTAMSLIFYGIWVRVKRKRGNRFVLLVAVLGRSLYPLLVSLTPSPAFMLAAAAFNGIVFSGMNLMFFEAFLDTVPKGREARFLAVHQTVISLTGSIAPPIGAFLLPYLGIRATLAAGTAVALIGFAVFLTTRAGCEVSERRT